MKQTSASVLDDCPINCGAGASRQGFRLTAASSGNGGICKFAQSLRVPRVAPAETPILKDVDIGATRCRRRCSQQNGALKVYELNASLLLRIDSGEPKMRASCTAAPGRNG